MGFVDAMGPLAGTIQKQYALSGFMAGLLPAFAFVAFAVFSVPGGILAARIGMRNLLILALALSALGVLIPTVVMPGYALLLGAVFVLGVGTTLLQVAGNPIMRDGSTALVARLAVGEMGWRRLFPIFLVLTLVGLASLLALRVKEARATEPPSVRSSLALLREPVFGLAVLGILLYVGAEVGLSTWLGPRLESQGFAEARAKFLGPTLFFACLMIGRLVGSGVLNFLSSRAFFRLSAGLGVLGIIGLLSGLPSLAIAGVVACGLGFANIWPLLFSLTVEARPERSAELSGLMCMAIFGGAVLPPLMGRLRDISGGFELALVVPLAAFAYLLLLSLRGASQAQPKAA
jgi:fucose permease